MGVGGSEPVSVIEDLFGMGEGEQESQRRQTGKVSEGHWGRWKKQSAPQLQV